MIRWYGETKEDVVGYSFEDGSPVTTEEFVDEIPWADPWTPKGFVCKKEAGAGPAADEAAPQLASEEEVVVESQQQEEEAASSTQVESTEEARAGEGEAASGEAAPPQSEEKSSGD